MGPDLEKPPGLGFQPGPAFLSAREAELGYGFAVLGRYPDAPPVRGVKGRDELGVGLPKLFGLGFQPGRGPPARGLPLLEVKGRGGPPSLRKGRDAAGRGVFERSEPVISSM